MHNCQKITKWSNKTGDANVLIWSPWRNVSHFRDQNKSVIWLGLHSLSEGIKFTVDISEHLLYAKYGLFCSLVLWIELSTQLWVYDKCAFMLETVHMKHFFTQAFFEGQDIWHAWLKHIWLKQASKPGVCYVCAMHLKCIVLLNKSAFLKDKLIWSFCLFPQFTLIEFCRGVKCLAHGQCVLLWLEKVANLVFLCKDKMQ